MTKAFGYLRVSGASQVEGDGPERQELAIRAFSKIQDIQIERVFLDGGVSGKTEWENRPSWVEMLKAIADNGVRTIVIEKLDRLARDLMVQEHILKDLERRGVTIISVAEPDLCVSDPSRKLLRQIMGSIAEYDRAMIVVRMRAAKQRMRNAGQRTDGAWPYGSHPGKPEEREVLRWMIESRKNGANLTAICAELNNRGIPPRRGKKWYQNAVQRIVSRVLTAEGKRAA